MRNRSLPTTLLSLTLAATAACATNTDDTQRINLPNGGYDTTDEAPLFADSTFALLGEANDDPATSPTPDDALPRDRDHIVLSVIWGHRNKTRDETWTDWSGRLVAGAGTISRVRTVRFDQRDALLPRESRDVLAWTSHTRPHHDGIEVALNFDDAAADAGIAIETAPFSLRLSRAELEDYAQVFDVGDEQVAVHAFVARKDECASGSLRGTWSAPDEDGTGKLHGRVLGDGGEVRAHLRGHYGTRDDGRQVLFAKVIDRDGAFVGRMRGQWDQGEFRAHFAGRNGHRGYVRGRYLEGERGVFVGRWGEVCRDRPAPMSGDDMPADDLGDGTDEQAPSTDDGAPLVP